MDDPQKLFSEQSSNIEDGVKSSIDETAKFADETKNNAKNAFVEILYTFTEGAEELKVKLGGFLETIGEWTKEASEAILHAFKAAVREGCDMTPAVQKACDEVCEVTKEVGVFIKDNPVFSTLVVLGILALFTPLIIKALSFAATGPVAGSFAAGWQSTYAAIVPAGSLFSFFQSLGMTGVC